LLRCNTVLLAELDLLLNDPDVPLQSDRVWALLGEMARRDLADAGAYAVPLKRIRRRTRSVVAGPSKVADI
jgi:hypothetical protein